VKAAIAEVSGKREARDVVRALFAPEPAPEHATETETETEDTGSGNVTGSARGPVLPYDALVRALTAYAETEDMDAHVFAHNVNNAMMDIIAAKWATAPANA
jgi:hypothetical protein